MAQACLKCLKFVMCGANFLCFMCGIAVLGFGIYMTVAAKTANISASLAGVNVAHVLIITGIIITCVSFVGFLGALKENRCLLLVFFVLLFIMMLVELTAACLLLLYENEIDKQLEMKFKEGLKNPDGENGNSTALYKVQEWLKCCGVKNASDFQTLKPPPSCCEDQCKTMPPKPYPEGCYDKLKRFFADNFLYTGIGVILLCVVEVLAMCFAMTLFCHIGRTGLGYKL